MNRAPASAPANETRWLTPGEQHVWRSCTEAGTLLDDHLDRQLQCDAGMPHVYYGLLVRLAESPPDITVVPPPGRPASAKASTTPAATPRMPTANRMAPVNPWNHALQPHQPLPGAGGRRADVVGDVRRRRRGGDRVQQGRADRAAHLL
jgi:hypothetical protein